MSTKKTLEQAYFHINNGGITFSIIEKRDTRTSHNYRASDNPGMCEHANENPHICRCSVDCYCKGENKTCEISKTLHNRRWAFRVETRHFGSGVKFDFPLVPIMVRWTVEALGRVLTRMETPEVSSTGELLPTDGFEHGLMNQRNCRVGVRNGQKVDEYWPVPRETSEDSGGDEDNNTKGT